MPQFNEWEKEYRDPKFLTKDSNPQADTVKFAKFLKKQRVDLSSIKLVDLGAGTGRNGNYFAEFGAQLSGIELSETATLEANLRAKQGNLNAEYIQGDMGAELPFTTSSYDVGVDVMSSNSLDENGRAIFVSEVYRIIKPGGYVYIKALCKDGDQNAKELIKRFPGTEKDTYKMPETGIVERVFTKEDFIETYTKNFEVLYLDKKSNYFTMGGRKFKRNYWVCYMRKN